MIILIKRLLSIIICILILYSAAGADNITLCFSEPSLLMIPISKKENSNLMDAINKTDILN